MMKSCFTNPLAQTVHRYLGYALMLLIAAIAWWLVQLDTRVSTITTVHYELGKVQAAESVWRVEALRRLDAIDSHLILLEQRLYAITRGPVP